VLLSKSTDDSGNIIQEAVAIKGGKLSGKKGAGFFELFT